MLSLPVVASTPWQIDDDSIQSPPPSPAEFLGYPLGEWHLRHDQLNHYLAQLAASSPRLSLQQSGVSHQQRQQLTLVVTSAANQANLDSIKQQRQAVKISGEQDKLVLWLAYSIHGDEASGAHAAMALSYFLSHSQAPWVTQLLDQAVVLITPSQNPDGMDRFATWANDNKGKQAVSNPYDREHKQAWPGGRFNHYLADLNRDWLFLSHPESQGRVALFHQWQPHLVADFHEMGHHQSYFFQPGVPERTHPLTSATNQTLTNQLAQFHRQSLDARDQPYFSRESFDDFYYGKGSTYPDINGAVGILFEQASARGQLQQSDDALVSLQQGILNHFATSISSLQGALALGQELRDYQSAFYHGKRASSQRQSQGLLIHTQGDNARLQRLTQLLARHHIEFWYPNTDIDSSQGLFARGASVFIPSQQAQSSLLNALFDQRQQFSDATFYDVSSWDLKATFNLHMTEAKIATSKLGQQPPPITSQPATIGAALIIDWQSQASAQLLNQLQQAGISVRASSQGFSLTTQGGVQAFSPGTLIVFQANQPLSKTALVSLVNTLAARYGVAVYSTDSFSSLKGIDLGSNNIAPIAPVTPLIITGSGTKATEVGEWWFHLDNTLGLTTHRIDIDRLSREKYLSLSGYSHLILADGNYRGLSSEFSSKLRSFVEEGGVVIANQGAIAWLNKQHLIGSDILTRSDFSPLFASPDLRFADKAALAAKQSIGGAIVTLDIDNSHPLNFGVLTREIQVLKNQPLAIEPTPRPFLSSAQYANPVLDSGFLAPQYQQKLADTTAMRVETLGRGSIILLTDNVLFRNIWAQNEKIVANALFMVPTFIGQPRS
ncbi:peptidase M14 [Shewanella sp. NIFS-20-20]|nr:peptidase M14 [Shewanella sp. NIFS-20-20]